MVTEDERRELLQMLRDIIKDTNELATKEETKIKLENAVINTLNQAVKNKTAMIPEVMEAFDSAKKLLDASKNSKIYLAKAYQKKLEYLLVEMIKKDIKIPYAEEYLKITSEMEKINDCIIKNTREIIRSGTSLSSIGKEKVKEDWTAYSRDWEKEKEVKD